MVARQTLAVAATLAGLRLDQFLVQALGGGIDGAPSRAQLQAWIAAGRVRVGGQGTRASRRVALGEQVAVDPPEPVPAGLEPVAMPLQVLFEDAHLLVVNKAAHLPVHPGAGPPRPTLVHGLLAHCRDLSGIGGVLRPGIVHRLDAGTTGALVVAKHDVAHRGLAAQFAKRQVRKVYLALVHPSAQLQGANAVTRGRIDTPFGRHRRHRKRFSGAFVAAGPLRRAVTDWSLVRWLDASDLGDDAKLGELAHARRLALVQCLLHTGRTHQLRVHLAEMGCPIVGDALYGRARPGAAGAAPVPRLGAGAPPLDHQALHAWQLTLRHPVTEATLSLQAPVPASWGPSCRTSLPQAEGALRPEILRSHHAPE